MKQRVNLLRKLGRHRAVRVIVPDVGCPTGPPRPADGKVRLPIVR